MSEKRFLTITALTRYIKRKFDVDSHLQDVWIKGEISNLKIHSRGHMYLTLKDENARLQAVMFASNNQSLNFHPENGMKVLARGEISVYESNGQYQIYIKEMQPDGVGNLFLAFEQLKKSLENEGLFKLERKRSLPPFPESVGVITSPTGAAIRDIFTTLKRRFPSVKVIVIPALVQGELAAPSIVEAIEKANDNRIADVLIVGRGGGSIEDLWPFNKEEVARAIYHSTIPIISAVGHETDFTIADFVADHRAPTPTGAAEIAVPHINELKERISQREIRMFRAIKEKVDVNKGNLKRMNQSYAFKFPKKLHAQKEQELDRMMERLERASKLYFEKKKEQWFQVDQHLKRKHPHDQLIRSYDHLTSSMKAMEKNFQKLMKEKESKFTQALAKLEVLNPLQVMGRGYSLVYKKEDKLIKTITQVKLGDQVKVRLKDGYMDCQVQGIEESEKVE